MAHWIRYEHQGRTGFGAVENGTIRIHTGEIIACGTSTGAGSMKPGSSVSIIIEGIGTLSNRYE